MGVPQLKITGLPGAALKRLRILGKKYNLPIFVFLSGFSIFFLLTLCVC